MTDNEAERMERLDSAARAQNSLLEHPRCVTHHACDCLQAELDRLKVIEEAKLDLTVLAPGEYALISIRGLTAEQAHYIHRGIPEELRDRVLLVDGMVHTLKPDVTPNSDYQDTP